MMDPRFLTYFNRFGSFETKRLSQDACVKHAVPQTTGRIETTVPCALCGQSMKVEWFELHLQKNHSTSLPAFLDAVFEGDKLIVETITTTSPQDTPDPEAERARLRAMLLKGG